MVEILIIEPDNSLRQALLLILELAGYVPLLAQDGRTGVAMASLHLPAAVLSEIKLPHHSGIDAVRTLRHKPGCKTIPIILRTSDLTEADAQVALAAGASGFLIKPCTETELLRRLRAVLPAV